MTWVTGLPGRTCTSAGADLHLRRGKGGTYFAEIQISAGEVRIPGDFGRIPRCTPRKCMILRSPQIIDFPKENQCFLRCDLGNGVTGADFAPPPGRACASAGAKGALLSQRIRFPPEKCRFLGILAESHDFNQESVRFGGVLKSLIPLSKTNAF